MTTKYLSTAKLYEETGCNPETHSLMPTGIDDKIDPQGSFLVMEACMNALKAFNLLERKKELHKMDKKWWVPLELFNPYMREGEDTVRQYWGIFEAVKYGYLEMESDEDTNNSYLTITEKLLDIELYRAR